MKTSIFRFILIVGLVFTSAIVSGVRGQTANGVRLNNMSVRAPVGVGQECLIGGFVIQKQCQLLIRAVGRSLQGFGIRNTCNDPKLQIFSGSIVVAENDNWGGVAEITAAASRVGAFSIPAGSLDAVVLVTLPAGIYSAVVTSNDAVPGGIALLEIYDTSPSSDGFYNQSVRAIAGYGESALIMGVVVSGTGPASFLFRGIGPGLAPFGVTKYLFDPLLTLRDELGNLIDRNDSWGTMFSNFYFGRWGAFPLPEGSTDAAIIFESGFFGGGPTSSIRFTAIVESKSEGVSGPVLAECYFVPRFF
ncbi:MAG TPA: hypothetical protein VF438_00545 [Candidatus Paceibacterota bacterium]